jgi:hypothetical protein
MDDETAAMPVIHSYTCRDCGQTHPCYEPTCDGGCLPICVPCLRAGLRAGRYSMSASITESLTTGGKVTVQE